MIEYAYGIILVIFGPKGILIILTSLGEIWQKMGFYVFTRLDAYQKITEGSCFKFWCICDRLEVINISMSSTQALITCTSHLISFFTFEREPPFELHSSSTFSPPFHPFPLSFLYPPFGENSTSCQELHVESRIYKIRRFSSEERFSKVEGSPPN